MIPSAIQEEAQTDVSQPFTRSRNGDAPRAPRTRLPWLAECGPCSTSGTSGNGRALGAGWVWATL